MLYKSKYNSLILKDLDYDSEDDSFYFKAGDSCKKIKNTKHKIVLCLRKQLLFESGMTAIKILVDNEIGWDLESHFEIL